MKIYCNQMTIRKPHITSRLGYILFSTYLVHPTDDNYLYIRLNYLYNIGNSDMMDASAFIIMLWIATHSLRI